MSITPHRSPRYPRHSLGEAVQFAAKLYEGAHRSPLDADSAYRIMGFSGKSGSSAAALGAIRQFGLVDGLRGDVRISDIAMRILEPASSQEELAAMIECARRPDAFAAIFTHFADAIPKAGDPIKSYLIRTLGFSRLGADECLHSFRATLDEIGKIQNGIEVSNAVIDASDRLVEAVSTIEQPKAGSAEPKPHDVVRVQVSKESSVEIRFFGTPTDRAFDRLIKHIELLREAMADE
jgi:hypothetical protein